MLKFEFATGNRMKWALACLLLSGSTWAQDPGRSLQAVDVIALDSERVQLTLTLSEAAPEPVVFTIDKPARLSLDLPATRLGLAERYRKFGIGNVASVASVEAKGRTRVVVELNQSAPYKMRTEDNRIILQLEGGSAGSASAGASASASPSMAASGGGSIRSIDFRRGEKGEGRVMVRLSDAKTAVDVREESGKVFAVFRNTDLPENLRRRLDVLDFATPAKFVDVQRNGANTEITVTPVAGASFEQAAYQAGDLFTLELQPFTEEKLAEKKKEPQFTGERISLSFQSVDIRSLLQIVADVAGTNMVISDTVQGTIAMRLQNVPWDQALDIILKTKGLGMRREGNVMLVAPAGEIAKREKEELEAEKQKLELAPLRSELIQVNYAKATDMKSLLVSENTSLLSERGRVTVDERTNTLLILETRDRLAEIRDLIARLDIPVRQVLIESRIVIASDDFAREMGVKFGVNTIGQAGSTTIGQSGSNNGSRAITGGGIPSLDDSYAVNLPTAGTPAGRIGWTILGPDFLVDLELSALQTEGRGEVISTPRVVTANGKQASIEQGREIPYQTTSGNSGATTSFKKAVLSLTVTPQITPDNRVVMDLSVTNDSQGANVATGLGSAPAIDTRRLETQVLIKSGETVVLGGVFQQDAQQSTGKVPFLGDIPLIGALFRNNRSADAKRELLIFVTPKVLQEGLRVN